MKRKRKRKGLKPACQDFLDEAGDFRQIAAEHGLSVLVRMFGRKNHRPSLHVMFNDHEGQRILDFWPATGKIMTADWQRGHVLEPFDAIRAAAGLQGGLALEELALVA